MDREERMRQLSCCDSAPQCRYCPVRPENRHIGLAELADLTVQARRDLAASA